MIGRVLAAILLGLAIPFAAAAQTIPTYTFGTLPGSPTAGQLAWITDGAATPIPGTAEIGGGTHKDLVAYDATQLRWEFVQRAPDDLPPEELPTFLSAPRISYDNAESGAAADDVQEALDELFAGGGGGGGGGSDNLGNHQATLDLDMNGNDVLEIGTASVLGNLIAFLAVDARTMGAGPIASIDIETWFAVDGVKTAGSKSRTDGLRIDYVNLTEAEGFALWIDAFGTGNTDLVGVGIRAACTGPQLDDGDEGCAALRTHAFDHWYEAIGSVSGTIPAGAGTRTLTISGITKDESKQIGESKLFITGTPTPVDIVDVPPGVISATGALDAGDPSWLGTGLATGQGVFTFGAGQVASSGAAAGKCFAANLTAYTPFIGGPTAYQWLRIASVAGDTITTEWIGQNVNAKTPYLYRAEEGQPGTEGQVADCGVIVRPLFNAGGATDKIADQVIVDFPASYPGASSPAFVVPAYGVWRLRAHSSLVSRMLAAGGGAGDYGHTVVNDLGSGRYQITSGYQVGIAGSLGNLVDGTNHGMLYGFDAASEPGASKHGFAFRYLDDPSDVNFAQSFGFVRFSTEDFLDDVHRALITVFNDPAQTITLHPTLGLGRAGDLYVRTSQLNTPNGSGPTTSSSGRLVEWSQIEGMPAGFADGSDDGSSGGATDLNGLTDVTLATPAVGATLVWNGTQWVNGPLDLADADARTGVLPDANVSDTITASNYMPTAGGAFTGPVSLLVGSSLTVANSASIFPLAGGVVQANQFAASGSTSSAVDLPTAEVSGILGAGNGGLGISNPTSGGILLGTGPLAVHTTPVLAAGQLLIGDGTTDPTIAAMSGDATMTSGGVVSLSTGSVDANEIVSTGVAAGTYQSPSLTIDADGRVTAASQGTNLLIGSGTKALSTTTILSGGCNTDTITAAGVVSTDVIAWSPNGDLSAVNGFRPVSPDGLAIYPPVPSSGSITVKTCNPTGASITPGAVSINWRVTR